jgi:hypothetical protein
MRFIWLFLLTIFAALGLSAQQTQLKGAKSFNVLSSLVGKSITEAKAVLKKHGLVKFEKQDDETFKTANYSFYGDDESDDDDLLYVLSVKNSKVVMVSTDFNYEGDTTQRATDLKSLSKSIAANGFFPKTINKKLEGYILRYYENRKKKQSLALPVSSDADSFILMLGDSDLVYKATIEQEVD